MTDNIIDLSQMTPDAVRSSVRSTTIKSPLTIFPIFGGILLFAYWILFYAGWIFTVFGGLLFVFGIGMFFVNYFGRYDYYSSAYFAYLHLQNEKAAAKKLEYVQEYLDERGFEQGSAQVDKLQDKMTSFERVLNSKFERGEMAYARYHTIAQQVFLSSLENLENAVTNLEAIDSIDPEYIDRRYDELIILNDQEPVGLTDEQFAEKESLDRRLELRTKHLDIVDNLLSANEQSMTELDNISSKLATARTDGKNIEAELQRAINSLNKLGEETQKNWGGDNES